MKICFIDTNLFIRYLTNDDPQKADRVDRLLEQAAKGKSSRWKSTVPSAALSDD
jgi:predicted nucleic acid-binding protein